MKAGFDFGVSMGDAFQVEGLPRFSDWYDWTHQQNRIGDFSNADEATRFLKHFRDDILLAKRLGSSVFKFSMAWDRIEPQPGEWDKDALQGYIDILEFVQAQGMVPVICLQSHVLPRWMAKLEGVLFEDFPKRFSDYCEKVCRELSPHCNDNTKWLTFSRPLAWVTRAYASRLWPPGERDAALILRASSNLVKAHYLAVHKMREAAPKPLQISFLLSAWTVVPALKSNPLDWLMVYFFKKRVSFCFYRAIRRGSNVWRLPGIRSSQRELPEIRSGQEMDFIAIHFEGLLKLRFRPLPPFFSIVENEEAPESWWLDGIGKKIAKVIRSLGGEGLPVAIFQFSFPFSNDIKRTAFLDSLLKAFDSPALAGSRMGTVLYSPLTDCFEWEKGFSLKRGLVEIVPETFDRVPKPSFHFLEGQRSDSKSEAPSSS